MHVDRLIGGVCGKINKANPAVPVHGGGKLVIGRLNARNVGAGGEGADLIAAVPVEEQQIF
ncbi:hypothetical protein D3C75_1370280 [compost metagenome]